MLIGVVVTRGLRQCVRARDSAEADTDAAFATELMHRDAALLNLLDTGLGRDLDPRVAATGEQLRFDANDRMATAAELLEEWGEKVPVTSRHHSAEHSSDNDVPDLDGAPTGDDLRRLGKLDGQEFADAYVALLTTALEATREFADAHEPTEDQADKLAQAAVMSSSTALDAL